MQTLIVWSARDYIEPARFAEANIQLDYKVYAYPEYEQLYPPYEPTVTILDLLVMKGPAEAATCIWGGASAMIAP